MKFTVNPSLLWGAVFSVPAAAVDKYIKLASPEQLKSLLWVLRHASDDTELSKLCDILGRELADVEDYLQFWVEKGILLCDGKHTQIAASVPEAVPRIAEKTEQLAKQLAPLPVAKPTNEQILARASESAEINFLFNEAQLKLGRTVGFDGQCALLMMHDQYGLPVEVILMIIEYCVSVGKTANSYISSVGKDWAEKEIDTIEKADEQITVLRRCDGAWKELAVMAGITTPRPTATQSAFLREWIYKMGFDIEMIFLAYEEMADRCAKLSFAYMNKVLTNWHNDGCHTPEKLAESKLARAEQKSAKKQPEKKNASYDIDEFKHSALHEPIVYKKDKKKP